MFLKSLRLTNFRNYPKLTFDFDSPITVLVGDNAQGKSNFLESIYFLSTSKSPKADKDEELIKSGESVARVEGIFDGKEGDTGLEVAIENNPELGFRKRVKLNSLPKRVIDYIGNLSVVSFAPEDINLVTGPPSLRRWHIDLTLAQIDKKYKDSLTDYEEVITRKNKVLKLIKEGLARLDELVFWSERQVEFGSIVSEKRRELFEFLNSTEKKFGDFSFEYLESTLSEQRLRGYQGREIASCASLIGPHRDDFVFKSKERDLSKFGSRGEHRTAVLDLKLSEASFIEEQIRSRPILLLDDVFSELDSSHQDHVLELVKLQQTVIATVDLIDYIKEKLPEAKIWVVENGRLSAITGK